MTIMYYSTKMKSKAIEHRIIDSSSLPCDTRVKVTSVARPLLTPVAQTLYKCEHGVAVHEQNVCSFSNITSHRNRLLLFVKHSAMRILKRKYDTE
jgi:hypothetical protein